ncbi:hypothetical protein E9529_20800 [Blastococcus sp. KM273128]|uniref:hypothetical protein n=1 Tax=Blastococcus sp. KM273128 TaxID=2570314 RepID=UPI001F179064|nr:hypothetical protein [Blastococcus sp. KM273128]MCF6746665.1 hypothetical protein [Blastococcus sp. KM273128]
MPYETFSGGYERASRLGHATAAVRALADKADFYVPAERLGDTTWLRDRIRPRSDLARSTSPLKAALAIDGSHVVESVRDGMPSVVYGYAQAAAAFVDLDVMETQRAQRFVDPVAIAEAVNSALVSLDLPVAGAYTRPGIDIATSWRELVAQLFATKKVQVNRLDQSLLDLLMLLHGTPGTPAPHVPVHCPAPGCGTEDVPVPAEGAPCTGCGLALHPTDTLRLQEAVSEEGRNEEPLGRLRSVVELLVLVGLTTLLWEQSRGDLLASTLFLVDGPLAMYGEPAKLRGRAETYFQAMAATTPGDAPYLCGIEKSGAMVDYARQLARNDVLAPGELLVCDAAVIARIANTADPANYGKETYWGRKFIYRALARIFRPPIGDHRDATRWAAGA